MTEKLQFILDNWYLIFTLICVIIVSITKIIEFIGYPTEKKIAEIKRRLLSYLAEAEIELGSKTGAAKLSLVYDKFCELFPYTKKWISFEKFSGLVDELLPTLREMIENQQESESNRIDE